MTGSPRTEFGILPVTESARRILADDGTWTKGDARICAEFVVAAQADFAERVAEARAALDAGEEATTKFLMDES